MSCITVRRLLVAPLSAGWEHESMTVVRSHEPAGGDLLERVRSAPDGEDSAEADAHGAVLDGALAAFLDFGIRRTSMNEIARRSGVSPASLYRWFGTKDELVAAVVVRETDRFLREVESRVDRTAPADEQIADVTVMVARRLRDQPLLLRLVQTEPETVLPRLTIGGWPIIDAGATYLTGHLQRLVDDGMLEPFDPRPLAVVLARLTHSMLLTPPPDGSVLDDEELHATARAAMRTLLPRSRCER